MGKKESRGLFRGFRKLKIFQRFEVRQPALQGAFLFEKIMEKLSPTQLENLKRLLAEGKENIWYNSAAWEATRQKVLRLDRYECQICKEKGRYRKAVIVHHVKHLRDRPDLALSIYDPDTGERQLISVCKRCHEQLHPESQKQYRTANKPVTEERWD